MLRGKGVLVPTGFTGLRPSYPKDQLQWADEFSVIIERGHVGCFGAFERGIMHCDCQCQSLSPI